MNLCIVSEYTCTFDDFAAMVEQSQEQVQAFLTEYELIKVHDHKSVLLVNWHGHGGTSSLHDDARDAAVG